MKLKDKKLDFFLSMASMDQQLGLVIYENDDQIKQIKDFVGKNSDMQFEIGSLEDLGQIEKAFAVFHLTEENLDSVLDQIKKMPFHAFAKIIFVLEHKIFEGLEDSVQEKILKTFNPIFRS